MKQNLTELQMQDFICIGRNEMKVTELMNLIIEKAEYMYVYRSLLHIMEEPVIVKWAKENIEIDNIDNIKVSYPKHNREEVVKSEDGEKVYVIDLNQNNHREKVKEMLRFSIRDINNTLYTEELRAYYNDKLYIDDPLYDQYDFIFSLDNEVLMQTFIHSFDFIVNTRLK